MKSFTSIKSFRQGNHNAKFNKFIFGNQKQKSNKVPKCIHCDTKQQGVTKHNAVAKNDEFFMQYLKCKPTG
jgi:hypothetical protein